MHNKGLNDFGVYLAIDADLCDTFFILSIDIRKVKEYHTGDWT